MKDQLLLLSERDVRELLSPADVIETVEEVFRCIGNGSAIMGPIGRMNLDAEGNNFCMTFPSALPELGMTGLKWFTGYLVPEQGYPFSHGSILVLNDLKTGSPLAVMGAGAITSMRTAGGHGVVAAKYLAPPDAKTLTVIGGGNQAIAGINGFLYKFGSLQKLNVYCRKANVREEIREMFGERIATETFSDPGKAVAEADLLLMATASTDVIVQADWITPGCTVIAISAFMDLDPRLAERADKWVLGNRAEDTRHIIDGPGLRHGYPLGIERVYGDLSEIILGKKNGRERLEEIIVYSHMGMGVFDVACGKKAYERAVEKGAGCRFTLDEF